VLGDFYKAVQLMAERLSETPDKSISGNHVWLLRKP